MMGGGVAGFMVALMMIVVMTSPCVYGEEVSDHLEIKVQRLLKQLNKPALKSIKSEDGDIIDCVPITSQPALDHPLLANHTIQMKPSFIPEGDFEYTKKKAKGKGITQLWQKNGECPKNTVPIRRTKKEDILRTNNASFKKKVHQSIAEYQNPAIGHEYATMSSRGKFYGTEFAINVWNPKVQVSSEFSLAQTWLVSGEGPNLNSIEAMKLVGRFCSTLVYHDSNTRLFVFWTNNGYQGPICYNLDCPDHGFVQVSNRFTVGGSLNPVSQYDGEQLELSMHIRKYDNKNWWLKIGEEFVGYWSDDLFTSLKDGATIAQWGGEIVNSMSDGKHTTTEMGSGHFAEEGSKKASYFRNLMIYDEANTLKEPQGPFSINVKDNCYSIKAGDSGTPWGVHFFFGGPGRNDKCP